VNRKQIALLLLITIGAMLVHGYHPAAEDGELYLPGIKKNLNPALYRFNDQFFMSHAHMTLFDELVAASVRLTHLPFDDVIFFWHFACIFLFLLGSWRVARICFNQERAAWGGVALVAALLTIPVAGTALYIMDQYLSPRDISTAGIMLVLAEALRGRWLWVLLGILAIAFIHPLMAVFGTALLACLCLARRRSTASAVSAEEAMIAAAWLLPLALFLAPISNVYGQLLHTNYAYFLVLDWRWYEWLGIIGPLLLLWALASYDSGWDLPNITILCWALIAFELSFFAAALLLCIPRLAPLALAQPMRCLHLVFILLFLLLGGVLAESLLKSHVWRWALLLAPLCLGMFLVQRRLFPATEHLELPGRTPQNAWVQAFAWVRDHTPQDAIFALNPNYMNLPGEDEHGFRAVAERSALASVHDAGSVIMFPALASRWEPQIQAQHGWRDFQPSDFRRLRREYGVTWIVLERRTVAGLNCPYENGVVMVCRVE
jgi:hypothetical protein